MPCGCLPPPYALRDAWTTPTGYGTGPGGAAPTPTWRATAAESTPPTPRLTAPVHRRGSPHLRPIARRRARDRLAALRTSPQRVNLGTLYRMRALGRLGKRTRIAQDRRGALAWGYGWGQSGVKPGRAGARASQSPAYRGSRRIGSGAYAGSLRRVCIVEIILYFSLASRRACGTVYCRKLRFVHPH